MSCLIFSENTKKIKMSSAAVLISALRFIYSMYYNLYFYSVLQKNVLDTCILNHSSRLVGYPHIFLISPQKHA